MRPDHIVCIKLEKNLTYCGRVTNSEFMMEDPEHAIACEKSGSRLVPCKKCMNKANENV